MSEEGSNFPYYFECTNCGFKQRARTGTEAREIVETHFTNCSLPVSLSRLN